MERHPGSPKHARAAGVVDRSVPALLLEDSQPRRAQTENRPRAVGVALPSASVALLPDVLHPVRKGRYVGPGCRWRRTSDKTSVQELLRESQERAGSRTSSLATKPRPSGERSDFKASSDVAPRMNR